MAFLGRFQLGDWLPVPVRSKGATGISTTPHTTGDTAPVARLFVATTPIESLRLPVPDPTGFPSMFHQMVQLDSAYSVGMGCVMVHGGNGSQGFYYSDVHTFQIVAGGSVSGAVVAIEELERPNGEFAVGEYDIGTIFQGRNPY